ncbi:MAG: hypothetical protein ACRYG6_02125 [Janthinobacterium lividum]
MSGRAAVRRGCVALVVAALAAVPQGGRAQSRGAGVAADGGRDQRASGASLVVDGPCAAAVELREDPFLLRSGGDGQVALAAEPEGSGPGMAASGGVVRIGETCGRKAERLVLRVSPGMPVRLAGNAEWRVEALGGEVEAALHGGGEAAFGALRVLRLSQDGGGDVRVASVSQRLEATLSGAGDLTVGEASGEAVLRVSAAGDVAVGTASLDTLDVTGSGGGDVSVGAGRVGRLSAVLSGGSDLHLAAVVRDARLVANGGSGIEVARVDGSLVKVESGGGTVTVQGRAGEAAMPVMPQMPAMPIMPAMPVMPVGVPGVPGWLAPGLVGLGVLVAAGVALRARAARRRRPVSLRGGWRRGVAPATGWARAETAARSRDPEVAVLQQRLAAVEARVAQVERAVTSPEFELHRGFRDLAG